jgi:hypothetical protein
MNRFSALLLSLLVIGTGAAAATAEPPSDPMATRCNANRTVNYDIAVCGDSVLFPSLTEVIGQLAFFDFRPDVYAFKSVGPNDVEYLAEFGPQGVAQGTVNGRVPSGLELLEDHVYDVFSEVSPDGSSPLLTGMTVQRVTRTGGWSGYEVTGTRVRTRHHVHALFLQRNGRWVVLIIKTPVDVSPSTAFFDTLR